MIWCPLVFGVSITLLAIYGYGISFLMEETKTRTVFPRTTRYGRGGPARDEPQTGLR